MHGDGGRTLGAYQLLSQLAVGGMAEIYVARTRGVGGFEKLLALKVIHPNYSSDPEFVQMLVDEAKLSVQLQHANIVQTFDLGRVDEQYYIAMELIDGVDLYKLLRRASEHDIDFPFEVAAFICAELCTGLDYAHKKRDPRGRPLQIVHRDVSPQNVLVSFDGGVKIVDFGIAKAARRSQQTAAGVIKGKYYYMSPEQAWGDPIDARSDIFSAGILLYEMIVGQMLYLEEDIDKLLEVVRSAAIAPPSTKRMGVPRELEAIVMRALRKRADDRWSSAAELAQALTQFLHGFAPDFSRARLAAFVREVMGDDPTAQRRDPRAATAAAAQPSGGGQLRDENSLLFKLDALKPDDERGAAPRRADEATHVHGRQSDFSDSERTIVDSSDRLNVPVELTDQEATRPVGPALQRGTAEMPSGQFDLGFDDPAAERARRQRRGDEDEQPTGARRLPRPSQTALAATPAESPLPGVRATRTPAGRRAPRPLVDEEATGDRGAIKARAPSSSRLTSFGDESDPPTVNTRSRLALSEPAADAATVTIAPAGAPRRPATGETAAIDRRRPATSEHAAIDRRRTPTGTSEHAAIDRRRPVTGESAAIDPARRRSPTGTGENATIDRRRPATGESAAIDPARRRPPTHEQAQLPPPPSLSSSGARPSLRTTFDEPTRIPPSLPPPIDSGRWEPEPQAMALPYASLDGEPDPHRLPRTRNRLAWIGLAGLVALALGLWAALSLGGGETRATLSIVSLPPGAEVRVDGNPATAVTPLQLTDVDPRLPHHIRVFKSGWDIWESDVKFPANEHEVRVQAVLVPTVGTLQIVSQPPGAEAIVNGRIRGVTPATVGDLPPNDEVVIELRLRGYKVAHKTLGWGGKRMLNVSIPLEKAK